MILQFSAALARACLCYTATQGLSVGVCNLERAQSEIKIASKSSRAGVGS